MDEALRKKLVQSANTASEVLPSDLGGLIVLWGHHGIRMEDLVMLIGGKPIVASGQEEEVSSDYSTAMAIYDGMCKNSRFRHIIEFAVERFAINPNAEE